MAFQVKDFLSITASMVNHIRGATRKLTDFNVGSVNRTLIEASAVEIDELYQQMLNGLRDAIPVATYTSFGFTKLPAALANVIVEFRVSPVPPSATGEAIVIPAGSVVRVLNDEISYVTDNEVSIPAGGVSVSVRVTADQSGTKGNALANTITVMDVPITGVTVTNPAAAITGRDIETDEAQQIRFAQFIKSLSRGPIESIAFGAKTAAIKNNNGDIIEYVDKSKVVEPYITDANQPLGYIDCYIYNGSGNTSVALRDETQKIIDGFFNADGVRVAGWKAAGIVCRVRLVTEQTQNITGVVTVERGVDSKLVAPEIATRITQYIQNLEIGEAIILNELIGIAMALDGVYNVAFTTPRADIVPGLNIKLIPGNITLT